MRLVKQGTESAGFRSDSNLFGHINMFQSYQYVRISHLFLDMWMALGATAVKKNLLCHVYKYTISGRHTESASSQASVAKVLCPIKRPN